MYRRTTLVVVFGVVTGPTVGVELQFEDYWWKSLWRSTKKTTFERSRPAVVIPVERGEYP